MDKCERCNKKHSDLFLQFHVWEDDDNLLSVADISDCLDWAETICGLTPETAVNQYIEDMHHDNGVSNGDDFTLWIRPVNDARFGLRKYTVTVDIQVNYTSDIEFVKQYAADFMVAHMRGE